ncbi:MAG: Gfo/Idh/MocA family oxidoreductase [Ruminococcaceae bacterium]|nr:Gfo/Idh/MocA family oxidoreductase [Oscillospiraceae bacterium]
MKYATIGTSWIAQSYINAAKFTDLWELYAVYSRSDETAGTFSERNGIQKYYTDLNKLSEDKQIEAVYIASPNALHYEQSKKMLLARKHVICEKPATVTTEEYIELKNLADSMGLIYTEAIMSMHVPALDILKEHIKKIGRISSAHFVFCQLSSKYPGLLNGTVPNIFNPDLCTGALMDLGVYNLYLIAELFGTPLTVLSDSSFLHTNADHTTSAIFKYADFQLTLTCSKIGQGFAQSEIIGDQGTIGIDSISQLTGITLRKAKQKEIAILVPFEEDRTEIMSHEAKFFYDCIADKSNKERYEHFHETAIKVRSLCDLLRKQNNFPF